MDLWRILVFGTLRLVINCDFDRLPTDIGLLGEACRKAIDMATVLASENQLTGWSQSEHQQRQHRKRYNKLRRLKHSTSSNETKRQATQDKVDHAYIDYLKRSQFIARKAEVTLALLEIA